MDCLTDAESLLYKTLKRRRKQNKRDAKEVVNIVTKQSKVEVDDTVPCDEVKEDQIKQEQKKMDLQEEIDVENGLYKVDDQGKLYC